MAGRLCQGRSFLRSGASAPCVNRATVLRGKCWFCPEHDPGEFVPRPKKELRQIWTVGDWVRTARYAGQIKTLAPAGERGATLQISAEGELVQICKTSIVDRVNPGTYVSASAHLRSHGRPKGLDDGRHLADWEDES